MMIHDVHVGVSGNKKKLRVGRGTGSGHGKTCGRGHKGHSARSGEHNKRAFEGGQMPLSRRIPKRGFNNRWAEEVRAINVADLDRAFASGDEVTIEALRGKGILRGEFDVLKILGDGELSKKLKVSAHRFSKSAAEKIQKAGGQLVQLAGKKPVTKKSAGKTKTVKTKSEAPVEAQA
jgi:large subunit ribosomal protein L15